MTMGPMRWAAPALAALLLAACAPASPEASEAESSAPPSVPEPTSTPLASGGLPLPSFGSGSVPDLEALIPERIGGILMQTSSMTGAEFLESGEGDPATDEFLRDLGVSADDLSVAFGFGISDDLTNSAAMFVFRATGAGRDRLLSVFKESTNAERDVPLDWQPTTVAGKSVETAVDPEQNNQTDYLYATGDLLFVISATDPLAAEEAIASLP